MNKKTHPPKWATRFLQWFCSEELIEEIQGDLEEAYQFRLNNHRKWKADLWYISDVIKFFKPYSFEKHSRTKQFLPLFSNYLKVSIRNVSKQGINSLINVLGLSLGITAVGLVGLYVSHELTYDRLFPDSERTYRVINHYRDQVYTCMELPDGRESDLEESQRLSRFLAELDAVETACHFVPNWSAMGPAQQTYVYVGDKEFAWNDFIYTNTGFEFQSIFPQKFILGNPKTAFSAFDRVVLTQSTAALLFGSDWKNSDLLDTTIKMNDTDFQIGGVVEDLPGNVHFDFGILVHQAYIPNWASYTYFKVKEGFEGEGVINKLNAEIEKVYPEYYDDGLAKGVGLVPLHDVHFTDGMLYEIKPIANVQYLTTFGIVAIVILLIIWTNYANLSIATYAKRQKELGLRKVMGARGRDISYQIIVEATLLALTCLPIIWLLAYFTLPVFNAALGTSIDDSNLTEPFNLFVLLVLLVFIGLLSGSYPAIKYGAKSLLRLITGKLTGYGTTVFQFRRVLLTGQFFMLIALMSLTLIIRQQMDYIVNRDPGYEKGGIIFFDVEGEEKYQQMKALMEQIPEVVMVGSGMVPGAEMYNQTTYKILGKEPVMADGTHIYTSMSAFEVLGIQSEAFSLIKEGQDSVFIVNRTAAEKLAKVNGIEVDEVVGQTIVLEPEWENEYWGFGVHYSIAGIVDDFDYFSLKHESQSLFIEVHGNPNWIYNMLLKIEADDWSEAITKIEDAYLDVEEIVPFQFTFLDQRMDRLYQKERNSGKLASSLTFICIALSIMGLVGVVGYIAQARQKELGVRKTFGASIKDILMLICKEYFLMILVAGVLAVPLSIFLADQWLSSFAYRIEPELITVGFACLITLIIVLGVVVLQSYRSACMNPSDTLRYE